MDMTLLSRPISSTASLTLPWPLISTQLSTPSRPGTYARSVRAEGLLRSKRWGFEDQRTPYFNVDPFPKAITPAGCHARRQPMRAHGVHPPASPAQCRRMRSRPDRARSPLADSDSFCDNNPALDPVRHGRLVASAPAAELRVPQGTRRVAPVCQHGPAGASGLRQARGRRPKPAAGILHPEGTCGGGFSLEHMSYGFESSMRQTSTSSRHGAAVACPARARCGPSRSKVAPARTTYWPPYLQRSLPTVNP